MSAVGVQAEEATQPFDLQSYSNLSGTISEREATLLKDLWQHHDDLDFLAKYVRGDSRDV